MKVQPAGIGVCDFRVCVFLALLRLSTLDKAERENSTTTHIAPPFLRFQPIRARQLLSARVGVRREKETEQTKGEERVEGGRGESTNKAEEGKRKCTAVLSWFLPMTALPVSQETEREEMTQKKASPTTIYSLIPLFLLTSFLVRLNHTSSFVIIDLYRNTLE